MMRAPIPGMVELFEEVVSLRRRGGLKGVFALSNWEANTFKIAKARFPFLAQFDGRLISGEEKLIKPNPEFFKLLESRYGVDPKRAIFIDDLTKNTQVAAKLGYQVHVFETASKLRVDFEMLKLLSRTAP
jgi:2-haloacid dehalogenase